MQPLSLQEWNESLKEVLDDMDGRPLNVHRLMANHPQLLKAWWNYRNHSVSGGDLDQRDCEIVILRVAVRMRCWYEWASHVDRGQLTGLTLAQIGHLMEGLAAGNWPERDACLLKAVDELFDDRCLQATTQKQLAEYFTPNQAMDIIAIHGMYVTLGCMINTWGLELDSTVNQRLPDGISRSAFEHAVNAIR
jgi:alkylhydroperoxidase/carboxymuconolactone decarboxylase family protein YurZ